MISVRSLLQLVFALSCICNIAFAFPLQFENTKVLRVIDINKAIAREDIGIRAKNIDKEPATDYYFVFPSVLQDHVASISAQLRKEKTPLQVSAPEFNEQTSTVVYKVSLDKPVQPNEDVLLGIKVVYTHTIKALPKQLPQVARQHTVYGFNSFLLSPYFTDEVKTTVVTPSSKIASHSGAEGRSSATGNKVVYGPYKELPPFSYAPATCHFENTKPLLTATSLERDIEVSHWAKNLAVEEHYALRNDGASLEKEFSRVEYQMSQPIHDQTNVLKTLSLTLPASARDTYYRDEVGNVSTSNFRVENDRSVLEIKPRYPLFGGWNTTWYHGYNADLGAYVHKAKSGKYVLNINFIENAQDMIVDKATVRVVLPEGSTNVKVTTPFDVDSELTATHYTYFDSTGRTMVVLEKHNVVKEHELPFQIEYEYSSTRLLQKPIVVSSALFLFFVASIIINKMSFTISPEKVNKPNLKKE